MTPFHKPNRNLSMITLAGSLLLLAALACDLPFQSDEAGEDTAAPTQEVAVLPEEEETPSQDIPEDSSATGAPMLAKYTVSITVLESDTQGPILQLVVDDESDFITTLYWTDSGSDKIQRARVDDFGVMDVVAEGLEDPAGILVDLERGKLVWTDAGTNRVQRADLDGSRMEDLVTEGANAPFGIALDPVQETLYWSNAETFNLTRTDVNGGPPMPAIAGPVNAANGVAIDEERNRMYWVEQDRIRSASLNGFNLQTVLDGLDQPHALTIDPDAEKLYWTEKGLIRRANLDGSDVQDLVFGLQGPSHGLVLDLEAGKLYWTNFELGTIQRANLDGSEVEEVVIGLVAPSGLAIQTGETFLRVPCGLVFTPEDEDEQRLMVVQEDVASVPAGGRTTLRPYVICIDATQGVPSTDGSYQIGSIAQDDLLRLAQCVCDRRLVNEDEDPLGYVGQQFGLQMSVWQVSGGLGEEELREEMEGGEGALGTFAEIAEMFDMIAAGLPSYVDWLEECEIEITP